MKAKIRNLFNQVDLLHLTRDTIWESDENKRKQRTQENKEVSQNNNTLMSHIQYRLNATSVQEKW